jgi:hypothetical protein
LIQQSGPVWRLAGTPALNFNLERVFGYATVMRTWERHDPDPARPVAAPLDRCAELLRVDLATVRKAAAKVEPYIRADGTKVWSLMQLERQLHPEAFGPRRPGGYITRRRAAGRLAVQGGEGPEGAAGQGDAYDA